MSSLSDSYVLRMRMEFALKPHKVTKSTADMHGRMSAYWVEKAQQCGRPPYLEAGGFATDRWGKRGRASVCGHEKAYGPCSRTFWGYVWRAVKAEFLAGWHREMGTTYTYIDDARYKPIITGLCA